MDDDVWDDEDTESVPASSNDKFQKDLEKLQEIHSKVILVENESNGLGRIQSWNSSWTIPINTGGI
jgi:hypothetical protein